MPAKTAERVPRSQSRVCSVRRIRRAGADTTANACCGDIAARKYATSVVVDTRPSTRSDSGAVSEITAVAADDWPTNERLSRRASVRDTLACWGKRWDAAQPAALPAAVA